MSQFLEVVKNKSIYENQLYFYTQTTTGKPCFTETTVFIIAPKPKTSLEIMQNKDVETMFTINCKTCQKRECSSEGKCCSAPVQKPDVFELALCLVHGSGCCAPMRAE